MSDKLKNYLHEKVKEKRNKQMEEDFAYQREQKKKGIFKGIPPKNSVDNDLLNLAVNGKLYIYPVANCDMNEKEFNLLYGIKDAKSLSDFAKKHSLEVIRSL